MIGDLVEAIGADGARPVIELFVAEAASYRGDRGRRRGRRPGARRPGARRIR